MGAWWQAALMASLVGLWFSLSYLKQHNYKWGFNDIGNHLYISLLLKVQKWFQNATIIALMIPLFLKDLLYNPVSYTHLDVYKRQTHYFNKSID